MSDNKLVKAILSGIILGTICSAFFAVEGLLKLADDQIKLNKKLVSQLKDCEEKLLQCKETLN